MFPNISSVNIPTIFNYDTPHTRRVCHCNVVSDENQKVFILFFFIIIITGAIRKFCHAIYF